MHLTQTRIILISQAVLLKILPIPNITVEWLIIKGEPSSLTMQWVDRVLVEILQEYPTLIVEFLYCNLIIPTTIILIPLTYTVMALLLLLKMIDLVPLARTIGLTTAESFKTLEAVVYSQGLLVNKYLEVVIYRIRVVVSEDICNERHIYIYIYILKWMRK